MPHAQRAPRLRSTALLVVLAVGTLLLGQSARPPAAVAGEPARDTIPNEFVKVDDGDSVGILWPSGIETVRILGIDAPEIQHLDLDIPYAQPFGETAAGFLEGCVAAADRVEILRSGRKDAFGRTLGYLYVNGKNYSVLALSARLAVESVGRYGSNGLPAEAAECRAAAKAAGPVPFEDPHVYRARMARLTRFLKEKGLYPLPK